jgi:hypothetical protein
VRPAIATRAEPVSARREPPELATAKFAEFTF